MSDDYARFSALSGLDAWITRDDREEPPCEHRGAKWNENETVLHCFDCHEDLRVVDPLTGEDVEPSTIPPKPTGWRKRWEATFVLEPLDDEECPF